MTDLNIARNRPAPALTGGVTLGLVLAAWFAAVTALAANGAFLINVAGLPVMLGLGVMVPAATWLLAYAALPGLRRWVASLDLAVVAGIQTARVIGIVFLFLWGMGSLPAVFAWPAGFGDIAVGVFAIGTTLAIARREAGWQRSMKTLVWLGIADFVLAFATGILSGSGRPLQFEGAPSSDLVQSLPMVLIPAFGVPLFLIAHLIAVQKLRSEE